MMFSLLHTSARPGKWREIYDAWLKAADDPDLVEYVLVVDARWGFPPWYSSIFNPTSRPGTRDTVIFNTGRRCYVEGVNLAAGSACGDVLIVNADDQYPCEHWDSRLKQAAADTLDVVRVPALTPPDDFVLWANTGTPTELERGIVVMPIVSRARYNRLGHIFYPEYESMYADNDLRAHAQADGALFLLPREWLFPHRHPLVCPEVETDAAYLAQNRTEAYSSGAALWARRQSEGFPG